MKSLILTLLLLLSLTCQAQLKISREPSTNTVAIRDEFLINKWMGGTGYKTCRIAWSNYISSAGLVLSNAMAAAITAATNLQTGQILHESSNRVAVAAGSTNVTVSTNYTGGKTVYTIDATGGGGSGTTYNFDTGQFGIVNTTNVTIGSGATVTNPVARASSASAVALTAKQAASSTTNAVEILDSSGNIIGRVITNGIYLGRYDFVATLQTTDNTTNVAYSFTPVDNSSVRVIIDAMAYNSTSSSSHGRIAAFKTVSGSVSQISITAAVGTFEDDSAYECLIDTSSNTIRVRVAGNTAKTVNWTVYGHVLYSQ